MPLKSAPDKNAIIVLLVSIALLLFAHSNAASNLIAAWQTDEYSHGLLIPFISGLIAWHILTKARPAVAPSWWGASLLCICGLFLLLAEFAAFQTAAHYGFIVGLMGICLAFIGKQATRLLAPAFIYLFFAIPLPHLLYSSLSQDLQLISSTIGVFFLDLFGMAVYQDGNIIDLGGYKLQVVEACSGLRYLFPLMSFGYLMAYLLKDKTWKRLIVLVSPIPITIFMNSLRIAVIGVTVNWWGIEMAEGLIHDFEGWVVFFFCVMILLAEVIVLMKIGTGGHFNYEIFGLASGALFSSPLRISAKALSSTAIAAVLSVVFGLGLIQERTKVIPEHPPFSTFPTSLGSWIGKPKLLEPDVLASLQLSDYVHADYSNGNDRNSINFYIAYYDSQSVGSSTHSPSSCIPGGGWQIKEKSTKTVALSNNNSVTVSRFLIKKHNVTQLVYFWFDERGRNITETSYAKWYMFVDSITMKRTDGALIRVVTQISDNENIDDAEKRLVDFISEAFPAIKTFIPGASATSNSLYNP